MNARTSKIIVEPSTSSATAAAKTILSKTVSSPTALNIIVHPPPKVCISRPTTPTTAQTGRQTSVNFRHSQLYDSGAESCGDADEQTRLIRTPSSRSHKFIIIPSTPPIGAVGSSASQFRQTISASSLSAMATNTQKSALSQTPQKQQQKQTRKLLTSSASLSTVAQAPSFPQQVNQNLNGGSGGGGGHGAANLPQLSQSHSPSSPSDVIHQINATTTTTATASTNTNASGVTFTIEDCQSDNVDFEADATTTYSTTTDPVISSINSATKFTPTSTELSPPHSPSASIAVATIATLPIIATTSAAAAAATTSTLEAVSFRPRNDRNSSSMRSVVSAYAPSTRDSLNDTFKQQHYLHPTSSYGKDLCGSSYIYHDPVANQIYSDVTSVRSLASIGIGSTDGRKLVIRRVPHTPNELFSLVHPPSPHPPGLDYDDDDSFMDMSDETANLKPRQQHWGNKMQFVLACIGYSVGLGNVWRFPYMCYKSGGGVFLVPYCIILFVCSIPLLFMELSIGQYTGRGPIGALGQLCPLFKGAGLASVVVSFLMSTYYSVIIGYSIYYFFTSFKSHMPWTDCNNRWNTLDCWVPQRSENNATAPNTSRTPSEEFFENKVLQISRGIEYPGLMRWELFACLICAWLMVYFATWKSIKSSAKVRYFTATFPFVLIIILMGRAVTLEGADKGLRYFFRPNWSELKNANVWINAASQNFNSLGITFGSMISFASYNKYSNNILRDTIAVSVVNILTSLLVGVFAFATLGNLALEQNTNVRDVIGDGPGLIFVVYPQAMAKMPYAQLWAVMFFFMLLCLGLNSQFAIVEVVVTSIQDGFPNWIKRNLGYHEIVVLFVCVISFLFGLPNLIQGGIYFFQLMDHYAASVSIMFLAFCQMIAIAWFYGTGRLSKNIKQMTGKAPSLYLKSCWILLGPSLLFAIWILSLINYKEPSYHNGNYKYPEWAYGVGWMLASLSLVCIPGYALINILRSPGDNFWERVKNTLRPNIYECRICGEHHCEHDFPEQEQYMLAQEMSGIYKPSDHMKSSAPLHLGQRDGYNQMRMQQQETSEFKFDGNRDRSQYDGAKSPIPTASTSAEAAAAAAPPKS